MNKISADLIVVIHFAWILFMLWGLFLTAANVIGRYILRRPSAFMDRWIFRTVHLAGILFVGLLAALNQYCPLTILEYNLRRAADPAQIRCDFFIIRWIQRLVYPDIRPLWILIASLAAAVFTLGIYLLCPPAKIKSLFCPRCKNR